MVRCVKTLIAKMDMVTRIRSPPIPAIILEKYNITEIIAKKTDAWS